MEKRFHSSALLLLSLFLFLLFSSSTLSTARNIAANKELKQPSTNGYSVTANELEDTYEFATLMGAEEICRGEDEDDEEEEECSRRRMISEAHLDYIYTQRHNHKP